MTKILLVGFEGGSHLGGSFFRACLGSKGKLQAELMDGAVASSSSALWSKLSFYLLGHPFPNSIQFNDQLMSRIKNFKPSVLICLGNLPVSLEILEMCRRTKIRTSIFLTDDPWNMQLRNQFLMSVLKHYAVVFTPRRANIDQLSVLGCRKVRYLPFGYDNDLFHPVALSEFNAHLHKSDVMFAGGADADRLPYISALIDGGLNVGLYGGYWDRFSKTRQISRGLASTDVVRKAIATCKVALCLVRRANRDGHVMRTFEVPAVGACMLTEDSPEHREIFGEDGQNVFYFNSLENMVERCRWLISHPNETARLSASAHRLITEGANTYRDRLDQMLEVIFGETGIEATFEKQGL